MAGLATMSAMADPLPVMVGDFNTEISPGGAISSLYAVGGQAFFLGNDTTHGTELWRSDGTTAGTWLVKDIVAGIENSGVEMLGQTNGQLLFSIPSGRFAGVWRSDGTEEGTFRVAEVSAKNAKGLGGLMWFDGTAPGETAQESEPWRTDGTVEGTFSLGLAPQAAVATAREIKPRSTIITLPTNWIGPSQPLRFQFASMSGGHYFINGDRGLWKSGGTIATTECIAALPESAGSLVRIENSGSWLSLLSSHSDAGLDWWASNGVAGELVQLCDGAPWYSFQIIGRVGNVSVAMVTSYSGVLEFWKSDGTPAGTVRLAVKPAAWSEAPSSFTVSNGKIYFSAHTAADGREPWVLDPQTGSIAMLKGIKPKGSSSSPANFRSVGGAVYFTAYDKAGGHLWTSTSAGKQAGTKAMTSLLPKGWSILSARMSSLGDTLLFTADHADMGVALWRKDANAKKAALVGATFSGNQSFLATDHTLVDPEVSGDTVYFIGNDGSDRLLWRTKGNPAETYPLEAPRVKATRWIDSGSLTVVNDRIVFSGPDPLRKGGQKALLAATDRPASAGRIAGIPADSYPRVAGYMIRSGNHAYFVGYDSRLWTTDGTGAGTFHFVPPGESAFQGYGIPDGRGGLFFHENYLGWGGNIWLADAGLGTATKLESGPGGFLTIFGEDLYFTRENAAGKLSLYRNPGVVGSTTEIAEVSGASSMKTSAGLLWIVTSAAWEENRRDLWRSDGTAEGTFIVAIAGRDTEFQIIPDMPAGQPCLFFAKTGTSCELWSSNGTVGGTQRVLEEAPEWSLNSISVQDRIYFSANDGINGHELWKTDGTAEGTVMVADLTGDSGSSSPAHFSLAGSRLYFSALTEEFGREWYTLDVSGNPAVNVTSD